MASFPPEDLHQINFREQWYHLVLALVTWQIARPGQGFGVVHRLIELKRPLGIPKTMSEEIRTSLVTGKTTGIF